MAEMPDRPFCAGGGTARRAGHEHQASAAGDENTGARKWAHDREHRRLTCLEPPYTEPYVRWCGRTGSARARTYPIRAGHRDAELGLGGPCAGHGAKRRAWCTSFGNRQGKPNREVTWR